MGSLTVDTVQILLDAVDSGVAVLDLAEVVQADESAVHVLDRLRTERCTLLACPRWLELWLASAGGDPGDVCRHREAGDDGGVERPDERESRKPRSEA
jgi:hypothetical protein